MGTGRYRDDIEPVLRPVLAPDETLLAASPLVHDPGTAEDAPLGDDLVELLNPLLYAGLAQPTGLVQRTFGRALHGSPESIAGRLFHAIEAVTAPKIAVTDQGLVVVDVGLKPRGQSLLQRAFGAVDQVATLVHRVNRTDVVGATPAPRGVLRRGRLLVVCTDGSACAVVCSPPSLAEPVSAAIGPPPGSP